jgi:hypothetical protein
LAFFFLNVRYLVTGHKLEVSPWRRLVFTDGNVYIYRYSSCLPRFFLVHRSQHVGREEILSHMRNLDFNPCETVFLEDASVDIDTTSDNKKGVISLLDRSTQEVVLKVSLQEPAYLVCSETYYPGWQATVDGRAVDILHANYLFRAVHVPQGAHVVRFYFEPFSYRLGCTLSVASCVLILLLTIFLTRRRRLVRH